MVNDPYFFFAQRFHQQQTNLVQIVRQFRTLLIVVNVEIEIAEENMHGITNDVSLHGGSVKSGERRRQG
jgi:predicted transport protein